MRCLLKKINKDFLQCKKEQSQAREKDFHFHNELVKNYRNETLNSILTSLKRRLIPYEDYYMKDSFLVEQSWNQHQNIIEAIENNDKKSANKFLTENWEFGMNALLARIE